MNESGGGGLSAFIGSNQAKRKECGEIQRCTEQSPEVKTRFQPGPGTPAISFAGFFLSRALFVLFPTQT